MTTHKGISFFLLAILVVFGGTYLLTAKRAHAPVAEVSPKPTFEYEIVRTPEAQEKGLGGRTDVPSGYGMLFVLDTPATYSFWMKGMLVPIDILWLSDDGTIVGIEDSVATSTYPTTTFTAPSPVRLVLELRAGESRLRNLTVGSKVVLPLNWQN